jgi:hypothetical protein
MKMLSTLPLAAALMLSSAAIAQDTTPPAAPATPPAATQPAPTSPVPSDLPPATPAPPEIPAPSAQSTASSPVLTDEQAKALKNKVVWSSDGKNVGEVVDVVRDGDGRIKELHADIGGFLGFGETRVRLAPDEFRMVNDRIVLTRTEAQVEALPKVIDN